MWTSVPTNLRVGEALEDPRGDHLVEDDREAAGVDVDPEGLGPELACSGTPSAVIFEPRSPAGKKNSVCTLIGMSISTAAAQNRSSAAVGSMNDPLGYDSSWTVRRPRSTHRVELVEAVLEPRGGQGGVADEALGRIGLELGDPVVVDLEAGQAQLLVRAQLDPVPHGPDTVEDHLGVGLVLDDLLDPGGGVLGPGEHVLIADTPVLDLLEAVDQRRPVEALGRAEVHGGEPQERRAL